MSVIYKESIQSLPLAEETQQPSAQEQRILDAVFCDPVVTSSVVFEVKNCIFVGILVAVLSTPKARELISRLVPYSLRGEFTLGIINALLAMIVYFFITNLAYLRK